MSATNPIVILRGPKFVETSAQQSQRDIDSLPKSWRKHQTSAKTLEALTESVRLLQMQLNMLRKFGAGDSMEKIRMLLCDSVTGESKYYLVAAEEDPDQTP